jgi:hypothetical protein
MRQTSPTEAAGPSPSMIRPVTLVTLPSRAKGGAVLMAFKRFSKFPILTLVFFIPGILTKEIYKLAINENNN